MPIYYIDFYTADLDYLEGAEFTPGDNIDLYAPDPQVPSGYEFIGWFLVDQITMEITDEQVITLPEEEYIMVAAKVQQIASTHTIIFLNENGQQIGTQTGQIGDTITPPQYTPPEHYDYSWIDENNDPMPETIQDDATYHIKLTIHSHTLTITFVELHNITNVLGTYEQTLNYGESYSVDLPEFDGFLLYWPDSPITGIMGDEDVSKTAQYERQRYNLFIDYVYEDTNETFLHREYNYAYDWQYSISSPTVTDYQPDLTSVTGRMPANDLTVIVIYQISTYEGALKRLSRREDLYGTISFPDSSVEDLTTENIQQGSVSIIRQCVEGDELMFGGVILSELNMGIWSNRSRYDFYGAEIDLTYRLLLYVQDGVEYWEDVSLGVFTVNEADRTQQFISITAYDNLQKLDKKIENTTIIGTPYTLFVQVCEICGLVNGTSQGTFENLPNGNDMISITQDTGTTWRDGIKAVCQMIGCFAYADNRGRLCIKQFSNTVNYNYTSSDRTAVTTADYQCGYYRLVVSNQQTNYTSTIQGTDNLLTMYMDAPAWDYGLAPVLQARTDILMDYLITIIYTPCELTIWGNPKLECGDRIANVIGEDTVESLITSYTWNFRSMMDISSVGKNPYIVESEKNAEGRSGSSNNAQSKLIVYEITNRKQVIIPADLPTLVAETTYTAAKDTFAIYQGNLQITVGAIPETFTNVTVLYVLNDIISQPANTTVSRLPEGKNVIPLFYLITGLDATASQKISIYVFSDDGEIVVEPFDLKSTLSGQCLVDKNTAWDGRISANDYIPAVSLTKDIFSGIVIEDEPEFEFPQIVSATEIEEDKLPIFVTFASNRVPIVYEAESGGTGVYTFAPYFGENGEDNRLTTNCPVDSTDYRSWIGGGKIEEGTARTIVTDGLFGITNIKLYYTGTPQVLLSNNNGITWVGYDAGSQQWLENNYMDASELNALPQSVLEDFRDISGTEKPIMIKLFVAEGTLIHIINAEGGRINA